MAILNLYTDFQLNPEKPVTKLVRNTPGQKIIAVGLDHKVQLKAHKTSVPTTLIMLEGEILFEMGEEQIWLEAGAVFEIPVDVIHEVTGVKASRFVLVMELPG